MYVYVICVVASAINTKLPRAGPSFYLAISDWPVDKTYHGIVLFDLSKSSDDACIY